MKKIIKIFGVVIRVFVLLFFISIANFSTGKEVASIFSNATNRVINLSTMALKLEEDIRNDLYSAKDTFTGYITGYGADCPLCGGTLSCKPSYYVKDGTTIYPDSDYGNVRIVASSSNLPCGSIVRFQLNKISNEPIINDFPAPVSPVKTFSPLFKFISISSIIPIFFMCIFVIIFYLHL